ncbi:hypothetical protein GCM10027601_11000 [Nocardioides ungokensis]
MNWHTRREIQSALREHYKEGFSAGPPPVPWPNELRGSGGRGYTLPKLQELFASDIPRSEDVVAATIPEKLADRKGDEYLYIQMDLADRSKNEPVMVHQSSKAGRRWWMFEDALYVTTDQDLTTDDVAALIHEAQNTRRLRLAKAHAVAAMSRELDAKAKRQPIPRDVKIAVWQRDGGRCVECDSNQNLEFDHIIPISLGGANTTRNLQLLCESCNRRKGASLG